jgi:C4-type Zn-finger protein
MRLPKQFNEWSNEQQRKWVADELQKIRKREEELAAISRKFSSDGKFTLLMQDDDRPDLIELKK